MSFSSWVRQIHRWLSIAFTLAVVANIVAMFTLGESEAALWIGFSALVPLIPLLITGLYMFVQPYAARRRTSRTAG